MSKALIVGAGNIGRGFLAELCDESGLEITFCDVNAPLLDALKQRGSYEISYLGTDEKRSVSGFKTVNSQTEPEAYKKAVAEADVILTAVGVSLLPRLSQQMAAALNEAPKKRIVMACENAVRASTTWKKDVETHLDPKLKEQTAFVDVAVDRIVPNTRNPNGDVAVEPYREIVGEVAPLGFKQLIKGVKVVDNLDPYIDRKLYCVNGVHTFIAWKGIVEGKKFIHEALTVPAIAEGAERLMAEMVKVIVAKHDLNEQECVEYGKKTLKRFANPSLMDEVERVGRGVLRKLSPKDRIIAPLRFAIEQKMPHELLRQTMKLGVTTAIPNDSESAQLAEQIKNQGVNPAVAKVTGLPEETVAELLSD